MKRNPRTTAVVASRITMTKGLRPVDRPLVPAERNAQ